MALNLPSEFAKRVCEPNLMKLHRLEALFIRIVVLVLLAAELTGFQVAEAMARDVTVTFGTNTAVVRWQGTSGVKYRVERSLDAGVSRQGIDAPTTASADTNILIAPLAQTDSRVVNWVNPY